MMVFVRAPFGVLREGNSPSSLAGPFLLGRVPTDESVGYFLSCARQGALSKGLKSHAGPTRGTASCTARVSIARWNLKEAGGKALVRRTETRYEANVRDEKAKIFKVQNLSGTHGRRSGGHKCGRECALPGEISGFVPRCGTSAAGRR